MEKKLYAIIFDTSKGTYIGPMLWTIYPPGIELAEGPRLSCDEKGAHLCLTVRCEPAIGKQMGWIPFEKPDA